MLPCVYQGMDLWKDTVNAQCENSIWSVSLSLSSGYRKIPGDTCVNDLEKYAPTVYSCNKTIYLSVPLSSSQAATIAIGIVIFVLLIVLLVIAIRNGLLKDFCAKIFEMKKRWPNMGYSIQLDEDENNEDHMKGEVDGGGGTRKRKNGEGRGKKTESDDIIREITE